MALVREKAGERERDREKKERERENNFEQFEQFLFG